jgi:hypothetical protein
MAANLRSFLKQQRRKVDEVIAPHQRVMQPRRLHLCHRHTFRFQEGNHLAVGIDQAILGAAGDPEQLQVGRLWVEPGKLVLLVEVVYRRREAADPCEFVGIVQAGVERLQSAHR